MDRQTSQVESNPHSSGVALSAQTSTILVPLDGSTQAIAAMPVAQELARLTEATLHILHVSPHNLPAGELSDRLKLATEDLSGAVLDQRTGSPARAITQEAKKWNSRLIVMCCHAVTDRAAGGFGVIAREILLNTPCPIIVVPADRGQRAWSLRRLLLPHDGTPTSALALGPVGELCRCAHADMTILHVATAAAAPPRDAGALATPRYVDQPQHDWPAWGQEFLARLRAIGHPPCDLTLRTVLCTEDVGEAIVRFAADHDADLIALAWRMHLEADRAQTMRKVVRRAPCPAMIYPVSSN